MVTHDFLVLRELAKQVSSLAAADKQQKKRELWDSHNSLRPVGVPIYIRDSEAFHELLKPKLLCQDAFLQSQELWLRKMIYQDSLNDDFIIEPWIRLRAVQQLPNGVPWGLEVPKEKKALGGSFKSDPPLKTLEDINQLSFPEHKIDEEKTAKQKAFLEEALDGALPIVLDRNTAYVAWNGDISTDLGYLRGMEETMWDIMDNPEWLHTLLAFMRDGILNAQKQAEDAGDWHAINNENQAMSYGGGLWQPSVSEQPRLRKDLWGFVAAQETVMWSPSQFDEFMFTYQLPILEQYGLTSYGCCEDLTGRLEIIKRCKNLRRIAITPWADVAKSAEQIGSDYVCSYRPNPSDLVIMRFDEEFVREKLTRELTLFKERDCLVDIDLKDIQSVQHDETRLARFVSIAREVATQVYG